MAQRSIARSGQPWVNQVTGEMADLHAVPLRRDGGDGYEGGFHVVSDEKFTEVVRHLPKYPLLRVFLALPPLMKQHNWLTVRQVDLAEVTGLSQATVSRAMKVLEGQEIFAQVDRGRQFDPNIAWKGPIPALKPARERWNELKRERQLERARIWRDANGPTEDW